ncbi:TetR/AcrR family transcriptional regulator [Bdellovibrio reynosensis]|uniref:TetR family transcriptional regulator n=1 Tax=Bdellovibrio reynosensis TaxID=2835041 RepID=A0ABY4CB21_9BACT|nr:TetR family transcriptional regulator [Bdellovibrio reynosensis]UOF02166.1 TetR family transcriptional regulator [Bdellovibrio reynosensis]
MNSNKSFSPEELGARQKIMDAAIELFARDGLHGVSTRDIAKASGLNLSLISYYFGGKEGLYKTAIQEFSGKIFAQIQEVTDEFEQDEVSAKSIQRAIMTLVNNFIDMRVANPNMAKIMTREKLEGLPFCREIQEHLLTNAGDKMIAIITKGQKAGVVSKNINPHFFMVYLVEGLLGYFNMFDCKCTWNSKLYSLPQKKEQFVKQVSLLFVEGILK